MRNDLGELFRNKRTTLGLTLQELARQTGYRNLNKGARRLESLERDGVAARDLGTDQERFGRDPWGRGCGLSRSDGDLRAALMAAR